MNKLPYIDTHAHFNGRELYPKRKEILNEMKDLGFKCVIIPGYSLETSIRSVEIAHEYDWCYASVGIHPTDVGTLNDEIFKKIVNLAMDDKVVAIGECGFDFHWKTTTKEEQTIWFVKQIELAIAVKKPLIIHSRDALQLTYQVLKDNNAELVGGVMHSYSGSWEMVKDFQKLNFVVGMGGPVTFKNALDPKKIAKNISLDMLMIETDCPYLTPHPFRGKVNTPLYLPYIVEEIGLIRNITPADVVEKTNETVSRVFRIPELGKK